MKPLLWFYLGSHPDHRGRLLAEIVKQDDLWLEATHDYIQWLFPLREPSRVASFVPTLDREVVDAFLQAELLRQHLRGSLLRMLSFYGLAWREGAVVKGSNWQDRKGNWFTAPTHNNLRITRILKSLSILGLHAEAQAFHACLLRLGEEEPDCGVGDAAWGFWEAAVRS